MKAVNFHDVGVKIQKVALHPRTAALTEIAYASHGLIAASHWELWAIYGALLLVSLAHLIWAASMH